jgi:glycosyltransferase involved in cell wall biosynthesis
LRITHLNTYDFSGGAARSAFRLHQGLRGIGHQSTLFVQYRQSADPNVLTFRPPLTFGTRVRRVSRRYFLRESRKLHHSRRPEETHLFLDDRSEHCADVLPQLPPTDILHLHWVGGFIEYAEFFRALPKTLPLVWTLHDMDPFTGGCGHARDCRKFVKCCGACPLLGSSETKDYSYSIWKRKEVAFRNLNPRLFEIVTPSRWLANEVRQSALMGEFSINIIPYGVDTRRYRPRDQEMAREILGVPARAKVLLFVAQAFADKYKGFPTLLEAISKIKAVPDLFLLTIGYGPASVPIAIPNCSLGPLTDERVIALAYNAADLFALPTLMDNFPNTALEAMASGLPTVASNVGGVPEIVRDGSTGILVEPTNSEGLASAIEKLLNDSERRRHMSANSRSIALAEYDSTLQAKRYVKLYEQLLNRVGSPSSRSSGESGIVPTELGCQSQ